MDTHSKNANGNKQRQDDWRVGRYIREIDSEHYARLLLGAKEHEATKARRNLGLSLVAHFADRSTK